MIYLHFLDSISAVSPDEVYNLAGQTNTLESIKDPIGTLDNNTKLLWNICEMFKGTTTRIFQAGSLEMYKGLSQSTCEITNFSPITPYAITKVASFWIIKYYREQYGMFCCNGILTTVESPLRKDNYLFKKVINCVKSDTLLEVGNINTYRDWIHASDAARGMFMILNHHKPDDYIISRGRSIMVEDMIMRAYMCAQKRPNFVVKQELVRDFEISHQNVTCFDDKLAGLGWECEYSIEDMIREQLSQKET